MWSKRHWKVFFWVIFEGEFLLKRLNILIWVNGTLKQVFGLLPYGWNSFLESQRHTASFTFSCYQLFYGWKGVSVNPCSSFTACVRAGWWGVDSCHLGDRVQAQGAGPPAAEQRCRREYERQGQCAHHTVHFHITLHYTPSSHFLQLCASLKSALWWVWSLGRQNVWSWVKLMSRTSDDQRERHLLPGKRQTLWNNSNWRWFYPEQEASYWL